MNVRGIPVSFFMELSKKSFQEEILLKKQPSRGKVVRDIIHIACGWIRNSPIYPGRQNKIKTGHKEVFSN